MAEQQAAAALFTRVWSGGGASHQPLEPSLIRALAHAGNYVAGAYVGGELVGATVAFFAGDGTLRSYITGVLPGHRGLHVGRAIKQHQRAWATARGITEIHWTFDPLIGRNAHFSLHRLGARAVDYLPDFYGAMRDGINRGDASDRFYVVWRLDSARAAAAAAGDPSPVPEAVLRAAVPVVGRAGDEPVLREAPVRDGSPLLVAVPEDVEALRASDLALATRWRLAVRDAIRMALADGYTVEGLSSEGSYVLTSSSPRDGRA
ncbi:hypothetical protein GCM10018965_090360 [Nonomuraea roseola]